MKIISMNKYCPSLCLLVLAFTYCCVDGLKSKKLCRQCSKTETSTCPASEAYPHMPAYDDTLIAGALQSVYVDADDRGVYSAPNIGGPGEAKSSKYNAYFGWKSTSGSASGCHRFRNYMEKCPGGQSYINVDKKGKVSLCSLKSLESLAEAADADWKSIGVPKKLNHQGFRLWVSHSTGKCLRVKRDEKQKNGRCI